MSLFRKPGEDSSSSSSDESSLEQTKDGNEDDAHQGSILARVQTLDSASSSKTNENSRPSLTMPRQNSTQDLRDLLLHALLEKEALSAAAERLGKDQSDEEVKELGREIYRQMAKQISDTVELDNKYAGDGHQETRSTAQNGISRLTRNVISRIAEGTVEPQAPGTSQALVARPAQGFSTGILQQPPGGLAAISGLPAPIELHLPGYPGMQADRYAREFSELEIVGKGGYGKVYKVKHKLDGSFYAVKRITVSPTKLARIHSNGPQEMESMLEEVRSLARFDHANIVRYHNAWLEFTTVPTGRTSVVGSRRLLEDASAQTSSGESDSEYLEETSDSFGLGNSNFSDGADIIFEDDSQDHSGRSLSEPFHETDRHSTGEPSTVEVPRLTRRQTRRDSQASQATVATISSTRSRMSAVEDVDEEDDADIENIPRSHAPYGQESSSSSSSSQSQSMVTHSDFPARFTSPRIGGPVLTLNVQMSLYESNLATFITQASGPGGTGGTKGPHHCFHTCISLELLNSIISGVEYLHAQGVVHRDLKPANIFLSLSSARHAPYGSIDIAKCRECPPRECLYVVPRIGDFGLVAALGNSCVVSKPVGTEFYRPEASSCVNEKLDVFALGVIAVEMMHRFVTRMERIEALTLLRRGGFPVGFAGSENDEGVGAGVQKLIAGMVHEDEGKRMGCEEAKVGIAELVGTLKEQGR